MMRVAPVDKRESVRPGRVMALMDLGFPIRQARFLAHVLVFSGVFLERQYRAFTGLAHGQKTRDFLTKLVDGDYANAITPGALHRGRLFHVRYRPLYEAIGEPNNRHRKRASLGRYIERLMVLDAVLADRRYGWLGTEQDKRNYFREALERELPADWYPHVTFGNGAEKTTRYFPDKLPIGVPLKGERRHVFLYLATAEVPADFRLFLLRHVDLLRAVDNWTIRVLLPRRLRKAAGLYRYAMRDAFMLPLTDVEELDRYFRARRGELVYPQSQDGLDRAATRKFGAARFEALYRMWLQRGAQALWALKIRPADQLQRGEGRLEFANCRTSTSVTPLVGAPDFETNALHEGDNLGIA